VVDSDAGKEAESRPPTLEDLLHLCSELNRVGAKYIVIGGMAIIRLGFVRATEDIDLLVDSSPENQELVRQALNDSSRSSGPGNDHDGSGRLPSDSCSG
jgi:hypothetical protein